MSLHLSIDDGQLKNIHLRIAEYAFRAYTKQRNNDEFNKVKALASDKTNLAFGTIVQTGGKDGTEDLESVKEKTVSNSQVMSELGLKM